MGSRGGQDQKKEVRGTRTPFLRAAATRLRRLQQICSRKIGDSLPDAVMFIGGVDGKFNVYSQAVLKYLFVGTTGCDLRNAEISLEDESLEDCVLIIRRHDVHVLYSETAAEIVVPVIARWPQCKEYLLHDVSGGDNDLVEKQKIQAFRRMVLATVCRGSYVGTPFSRGFEDFRDIEMWPLVQSFALEGDDRDGVDERDAFFTMQYKVQDIANALPGVFGSVDALAVQACVLRGSASLTHHLSAMRRVLDKSRLGLARLSISEEDLNSPLQLLYDFGVMQNDGGGEEGVFHAGGDAPGGGMAAPNSPLQAVATGVHPRVFLGARTSMIIDNEARSSAGYTVGNTGFGDERGVRQAEHFVVEVEEPSTGLCICRSHFLATRERSVLALIQAYRSLCIALPTAVLACSDQLGSSQEAEQHAISATSHTLSSLNEVDPEADWKMGAFVRAIDACRVPALRGSSCCSNIPGRDGSCILYVKLTLSGSRGAVAVGNSYAVVPSIIKAEEQAGEQSSLGARHTTAFLLTGPTCSPYLAVWGAVDGSEGEDIARVLHSLQEKPQVAGGLGLGAPLSPDAGGGKEGAPATMFFADGLFSAVDGRLQLFSGGLSFQALGCLPIIASMGSEEMESSTVESAGIIDVPGERGLLVLLIKFHPDSSRNPLVAAFPFLESTETCAIPICSGSSLLQNILQALTCWKSVGGDKIGHIGMSDIPGAIMVAFFFASPALDILHSSPSSREQAVQIAAADLSRATADLSAAQLWAEYLPASKNNGRGTTGELNSTNKYRQHDHGRLSSTEGDVEALRATVLLGLPGSGVLSLAAVVLRFSSGENDWTPIVFSPSGHGIDELELENTIDTAVKNIRVTPKTRVLIVISAEATSSAVCAVVARWRKSKRCLKIQCCTACMRFTNATAGQGGDERWRPFLTDQCAAGWISNVVLTGGSTATDVDPWASAHHLRRRLLFANPELTFLGDCSAQYAGAEALKTILRDSAFESQAMHKARRDALGPSWASLCLPGTRNLANGLSETCTDHPPLHFSSKIVRSLPSLLLLPEAKTEVVLESANIHRVDGNRHENSRVFRDLGAMEAWRLRLCMSTLFPAARVQSTGISDSPLFWVDETTSNSKYAPGMEGITRTAGVVSGIKRAGEMARLQVEEQRRRVQEAQSLNITLHRWLRESVKRNSCAPCKYDVSTQLTDPSVVGVVHMFTGAESEENVVLLEATPDSIRLSGLPVGVPYQTASAGFNTSEVVARASSREELDSVGELLAMACRPETLAKLEIKTRGDMSVEELDKLKKEHEADPLPQDWFFDGSVFVDYEGNRKQERPDMPEIIDRYLEAYNRQLMS